MQRCLPTIALLLGFISLPPAYEPRTYAQPSIQLSSSDLTVDIDTDKGRIRSILDEQNNALVVNPGVPIFEFIIQRENGKWGFASSEMALVTQVIKSDARQLSMQFSRFPAIDDNVSAILGIRVQPDEPGIVFELDIINPTDRILRSVIYPVIDMPLQLGNNHSDDTAFLPGGDGFIVRPAAARNNWYARRSYPGTASMQFLAYYDNTQGLSLQGRDTEGGVKEIYAKEVDDVLALRIENYLPYEPGIDFNGPPVVLYACQSSWMHAAEYYREWALEQYWATPPANQPEWLNQGGFFTYFGFRPSNNRDVPYFEGTDYMPSGTINPSVIFIPYDDAQAGGNASGISSLSRVSNSWRNHMMPLDGNPPPYNMIGCEEWENEGAGTSPYYFPFYPSEQVVQGLLEELKHQGHFPGVSLAGNKWMIGRNETDEGAYTNTAFDGRDRFEKEGKLLCVVDKDGEVVVEGDDASWSGVYSFFCPGTEWARTFFNDTCKKLVKAGFLWLNIDQMNGGGCPDCYSTEHGHPRGPGTWKIRRIRELMKELRESGQSLELRLVTMIEDPQEMLIDRIDLHYGKLPYSMKWPAIGAGSDTVPAFQFVYHTVCQAVSCFNKISPHQYNDYARISSVRSFIWGTWPSFNWDKNEFLNYDTGVFILPVPEKMYWEHQRLSQNIARTCYGPARKYLLGRGSMMLQTDPLNVPEIKYIFEEGSSEYEGASPSVMHSAWKIDHGESAELAFVFANASTQTVSFGYDFKAGANGQDTPQVGQTLQVYHDGIYVQSVSMSESSLTVTVPGLSVVMIEKTANPIPTQQTVKPRYPQNR